MSARRGRFIVFEGPDGVGKSTHATRLAASRDALLTREPGGTAIGVEIRRLLLDHGTVRLDPRAEALLMAADRAQHVAELVAPALDAGRDVVADRYLFSSVAYQGYGRELEPSEIAHLSHWATRHLLPDLVLFLDAPDDELARRRSRTGGDRLETAGEAFFRRVQQGYRAQAQADPGRWVVIDAAGPVTVTARAIDAAVAERLGAG